MSGVEVLTVIDFRHTPFQFYQKNFRIHFTATDPTEISGKKVKKLVQQLQDKLKNFSQKWGTINCHLSLLEQFSCIQVHGKMIRGRWSSVHFQCSDTNTSDNVRRRHYEKAGSLIAKEILSWRFQHYKTILTARAESK